MCMLVCITYCFVVFFLMMQLPQKSTRTDTLFPYTTLCRSEGKSDKPEELSVTLPAGSILSGVLVTGMDAPTGKQAQRDPFPSLIRIKNEAILPKIGRAHV